MPPTLSLSKYFSDAKIKITDGCWLWLGATNSDGYGSLGRSGKTYSAHKFIHELVCGPVSDDVELDHLCSNRLCVRPSHLEGVPHRVNVLRGKGVAVISLNKKECPKGHLLEGDNLVVCELPRRRCRICQNKKTKLAYHRKGIKCKN